MNTVIHSITLVALAALASASENNTHELPTLSGYSPSVAVLLEENINDGYDQSRTFGATALYQHGNHRFLVNYDMLTAWYTITSKRTDTKTYISNRTDRIDGIYSYKVASDDEGYVRLGIGGRYYGNLGGAILQDFAHNITGSYSLKDDPTIDRYKYDEGSLAALAQVTAGVITPVSDNLYFFFNINADATTKQELSCHGFMGVSLYKTMYVGPYINAEKQPYSETVQAYSGRGIDENTMGMRLAVCTKNVYGDISLSSTRSHFRLGFSF